MPLIELIRQWPDDHRILPNSIPVPFFGEICNASVATVGINPSENEFTENHLPRATCMEALPNESFTQAEAEEIILWHCMCYFQVNPYWRFFKPLQRIIEGQNLTYQDGTLAHLDLFPWATHVHWRHVEGRDQLLDWQCSREILAATLNEFGGTVLLANGATVVNALHHVAALEKPNHHQALVWAQIAGWNVTEWQYGGKTVIGWNQFVGRIAMPPAVKDHISQRVEHLLLQ